MRTLKIDHPAVAGLGRSLFPTQTKATAQVKQLLKPASENGKLGKGKKIITKGKWKNLPMYSLSLEERKTCPRTCQQWLNCYGNNMPFAHRMDHTDKEFLPKLAGELSQLLMKFPQGIVIRLHVLGDFFSAPYVKFWEDQLILHPKLRLFGYTHREKDSPIGQALKKLGTSTRSWIRWSDAGGPMSANITHEPGAIICPEQTKKTESCLTCGLCWSITSPITFLMH